MDHWCLWWRWSWFFVVVIVCLLLFVSLFLWKPCWGWEIYFKDLLNPSGVRAQGTQSRFNPSHPDHSEPIILESEVRKVVKTSPKGKAAGDDGITTEAIHVCGETGIQWLTTIFRKAWEGRRVPEDWQKAIVCASMEEEGQEERLEFLQRYITTQPCRENVRKDSRAAH